jgi:hypothetical protein
MAMAIPDNIKDDSSFDCESPFTGDHKPVVSMRETSMISSASVIVLAFILMLSLWDTWSTFTDILAPIPDSILQRCLLNACIMAVGAYIVYRSNSTDTMGRFVILGNLLVGIGLWELTEGIIETALGDASVTKLVFYGSCLLLTFALVMYLEKTDRLHVIDSPFMSPI